MVIAISVGDKQDVGSVVGRWRLLRRIPGARTRPASPAVAAGGAALDRRPLVVSGRLDPLEPELISGLLGRWHGSSFLARTKPRTRFLLIGLAAAALVVILAFIDKGLTNPKGVRPAIGLIINPARSPARVSLALLQDPVGLIAIVVPLLTPILFAVQVTAIQQFNPANERNITYRAGSLKYEKINQQVKKTNERFRRIGSGPGSFLVLLPSAAFSGLVSYLINRWGLFPSWNKTKLTNTAWQNRVYAGWWANPHSHLVLAIALGSLGCYFFYVVIKQVYMGVCFAIYLVQVVDYDFGLCANLSANTDGFWGMLPARRFMQATYSSALGHTIMVVGILVVWLPFNAFTVYVLALLLAINILVVIYPSVVGYAAAYREKTCFVDHILGGHAAPTAEDTALIERVWEMRTLPFRIGSGLTAITIYLLFPLLLAAASRLLGP